MKSAARSEQPPDNPHPRFSRFHRRLPISPLIVLDTTRMNGENSNRNHLSSEHGRSYTSLFLDYDAFSLSLFLISLYISLSFISLSLSLFLSFVSIPISIAISHFFSLSLCHHRSVIRMYRLVTRRIGIHGRTNRAFRLRIPRMSLDRLKLTAPPRVRADAARIDVFLESHSRDRIRTIETTVSRKWKVSLGGGKMSLWFG